MSPFMSVETYEAMLNRGWRRYHTRSGKRRGDFRSGRYMYKPDLRNTCCKLYAVCCVSAVADVGR
jgi:arginyl-tRNA--protein-N-Asp/Glu arginylyltransferase